MVLLAALLLLTALGLALVGAGVVAMPGGGAVRKRVRTLTRVPDAAAESGVQKVDETRADLLAVLCAEGHAGRLLLSGDRNRVSEMHVSGGKGYDYLLTQFVPLLRARGIDDAAITRMLVTNPAEIFTLPIDLEPAA